MIQRIGAVLALIVSAALAPARVEAGCALEKLAELPVTMVGDLPIVSGEVNGVPMRFVVQSGDFFNLLSSEKAAELGLKPGSVPDAMQVRSSRRGWEKIGFVKVKQFSLAGQEFAGGFLVGGGEAGNDKAGVIGQNILSFADAEYDLAHGMIRLMRAHGCQDLPLAYWATTGGVSVVPLEVFVGRLTVGEAFVNGVKMRALFTSANAVSVISRDAARRAGIDVHAAGVTPGGPAAGLDPRISQSWIAPVESFKLGAEDVRHTRLRVADAEFGAFDMLLGLDFFLSHHIYVANEQRRLYFTYNGGAVFNLGVEPTVRGDGVVRSGESEPVTADGFARRGEAEMDRKEFSKAVADLTTALEMAPHTPAFLFSRAAAYHLDNQPSKALADFNEGLALKPDDIQALSARAALRVSLPDKAKAMTDLAAADRLAAPKAEIRLYLSNLYEALDEPALSIAQLDLWIASHPKDVSFAGALNNRCWRRAYANLDAANALADCQAAIKLEPRDVGIRDSRALAYLRLGDLDRAAADYRSVLAVNPKAAWSLYGRGVVKLRRGQTADGKADIAAAEALKPGIGAEAKAHGLAP